MYLSWHLLRYSRWLCRATCVSHCRAPPLAAHAHPPLAAHAHPPPLAAHALLPLHSVGRASEEDRRPLLTNTYLVADKRRLQEDEARQQAEWDLLVGERDALAQECADAQLMQEQLMDQLEQTQELLLKLQEAAADREPAADPVQQPELPRETAGQSARATGKGGPGRGGAGAAGGGAGGGRRSSSPRTKSPTAQARRGGREGARAKPLLVAQPSTRQ